jgi:hypothetical protein
MHAVVVKVTLNDLETADRLLKEQVVPQVSGAPGFVNGYWMRRDNSGLSVLLFESEDAARGASEQARSPDPDAVAVDDVEVREVVAQA